MLNVHWNLTLAANAMSVDLPYGKMDEVEALKGVKSVMLVPQYSIDRASRPISTPFPPAI